MKGVYKITNHRTGMSYIGSSKNLPKRVYQHRRRLMRGVHGNRHLQNSWNKYGGDVFTFDIVSICKDYKELEQYLLDNLEWSKLYNLATQVTSPAYTANKSCYLLDLEGNILSSYKSMSELLKSIGHNSSSSASFNTKSVLNKKYRAVTKLFYEENTSKVKGWRIKLKTTHSDARDLLNKLIPRTMYRFNLHGEITYYKSKEELSESRGYTMPTLSRIIKGGVEGVELSFGLFHNGKWLHIGKLPTYKRIKTLFPFKETLTETNLLSFYLCTTC